MATGVDVEIKDSGATGLEGRLRELGQSVTVGIHEDAEPYADGTSVVMVGAVHEFGSGDVPQRSYLRGYVDGPGKKELGRVAAGKVGAVVDGADPDTIGEALGEFAVAGVLGFMGAGIVGSPAGPARTLDDTGHLRSQITHQPGAD